MVGLHIFSSDVLVASFMFSTEDDSTLIDIVEWAPKSDRDAMLKILYGIDKFLHPRSRLIDITGIKKVGEKLGYKVLLSEEIQDPLRRKIAKGATPELEREAGFLWDSNLIEMINEISYKKILNDILEDSQFGIVGAWNLAKAQAKLKVPLTFESIMSMHQLICSEQVKIGHSLEKRFHGMLRDILVVVGFTAKPRPLPSKTEFHELIGRTNQGVKSLNNMNHNLQDILNFAARHHLEFEMMHPFADGNGRLGRILVNYILQYFNYLPFVFPATKRQQYFRGFKDFERNGSTEVMEDYFLKYYSEKLE